MPDAWCPTGLSAHVEAFARDRLPPPNSWPAMNYATVPELAAYPPQINCAQVLLDRPAGQIPERPAILGAGIRWSYGELAAIVNRIAHVLVDDLGVRPGERVLMRSANNPMYAACWLAVQKIGAIAVATMPLLRARELSYIIEAAQTRIALCDAALRAELERARTDAPALREVLLFNSAGDDSLEAAMTGKSDAFRAVRTAADDLSLIAFTSGTTGPPKGCMHFHRDVTAICDTFSRHVLKPGPDDLFAGTPPLAFTFGLGALLTFPLHAGSATLLLESYTPESLLQAINEHQVTILFTAPTMYRALSGLVREQPAPSLKKCVSAGETLPKPIWDGWHEATGIRAIDGLGATEMLHIFIASAGDAIRPGATGKPIPGFEARVIDDDGNEAPPNTVGRLAVRGPTGCRYLANPERQAAYAVDGWNLTGDAYLMDQDGYFWFQARTDDMIVSAGYNISGPEVEAVLLEHPAVLECAVVAAPDEARGHIVKAYIVPDRGAEASDDLASALQDHVKATIAPYKYPRAIEFVPELPKTHTGKVQRFLLRQQAAAAGDG